ncbi:MAG: tRNA (adenosine(37)-N6)-dimethylallyltransferase MiaA [Bacteroidia bacterium]|nr:tRNA (adenosine(37)-N6)-dimethylallyltransferase MiaA [Bacteroidia bacterium]
MLTGPTASGKTDISIKLAQHWNTEIISCDSRQMYREMSVGTAKPDIDQLNQIPHHLIGNLSIHDYYSAYRFEEDVTDLLKHLLRNHFLVIMTGGTGLYMDAIINGIDDIPDPVPEIRRILKQRNDAHGLGSLLEELSQLDPIFYAKVDRNNPARVMRGLEVCLTTGRPFSSFRIKQAVNRDFDIILIGLELPRDELYQRINLRVDQMIEKGLIEEAKALYPMRELNALNTVGYRELFEMFDGNIDLDEAIRLIKRNTRHYAKRQITWNNRYPQIKYFHPDALDEIKTWIDSIVAGRDKSLLLKHRTDLFP